MADSTEKISIAEENAKLSQLAANPTLARRCHQIAGYTEATPSSIYV